jgi:hypothetical protein
MQKVLSEFEKIVTSICGIYWMSIGGYHLLVDEMKKTEFYQIEELKIKDMKNADIDYIDSLHCAYFEGNPNFPGAVILFSCTQKEYTPH